MLIYWGFPLLALRMLRMPSLLHCWNSKHRFLLSCTTLQNRFALWGFLEKVMFCSHLECASAANRVNVLYIVVKVKHKKRRLGVMPWKGEIPQTLYIVDSISTYTKSFISWHLEILKIYTLIYCFHAYIFSFVLYLWGPVLRIRYFLSTNIVKDMCSLPQTLAKIRFINRNSDIELWPNKTHCV